ncbi:MAG: polyprenyl synthetase family protein [Oligoflexia bacterium]|nr:polyprenyl synthetase family protein [Oligoflexia bacterium]
MEKKLPRTPSFNEIQELCLPRIEERLREFFAKMEKQGFGCTAGMSAYHLSSGGKRLRALMPCWIFAASGRDPLEAVPLGCAVELIHNATLVHDDLQDRDTVRRGMPTVWVKHSDVQAINCGDALFYFANEILFEQKLSPESFLRVMRRLSRGTLQVIEGQAQEFLMKDEKQPTLSRYTEVVRGKTAALIAASIVAALDALGADEGFCEHVERVAMLSGELFQVQDDLLDIYGNKQRDRRATDIAEGKVSALIACLNEKASPAEKLRVAEILATPREKTTEAQIDEVLALFDRYDIRGTLLRQLRQIQSTVQNDPILSGHSKVQAVLVELNERFLDPIRHLFS